MSILPPSSSEAGASAPRPRHRVKRGSASAQLHDSLRERIITLELKPGQFLSRSEIAADYGVSQTPVRDALIKLEEEGLVVTFPQSKTEVSRIDVEHALETHFLRLSLELEISRRLAIAADPALTAKARSVLTMQEAVCTEDDFDAFSKLDRDYHFALYEAAGVQNLYAVIDARSGHIDRLRNLNLPDPGKSGSILDCHRRILDAIEAGDAPTTEAVVREHLSGTLAKVNDIRERHPRYF